MTDRTRSEDFDLLQKRHPLPHGWGTPEVFQDVISLGNLAVHRVGIQAVRQHDGTLIHGSAAGIEGDVSARAWFELLERAVIFDRSVLSSDLSEDNVRKPSKSNGVALHRTWQKACEAARFELLERDRILRAWEGSLPLRRRTTPAWLRSVSTHDWWTAEVVAEGHERVALVFGFPNDHGTPLTRGYAARATLEEALDAAAREALQGLAFLCEEPAVETPPTPSPTPMFHLDYYLYRPHHEVLREWLSRDQQDEDRTSPTNHWSFRYIDLTPEEWDSGLKVVRAEADEARCLMFGPSADDRPLHPIA